MIVFMNFKFSFLIFTLFSLFILIVFFSHQSAAQSYTITCPPNTKASCGGTSIIPSCSSNGIVTGCSSTYGVPVCIATDFFCLLAIPGCSYTNAPVCVYTASQDAPSCSWPLSVGCSSTGTPGCFGFFDNSYGSPSCSIHGTYPACDKNNNVICVTALGCQASGETPSCSTGSKPTYYGIPFCNSATPTCTCIPSTCSGLGDTCGNVSDGCGGTLSCGTCSSNQTCSSNKCVTAVCTPLTSCPSGDTCGNVSDGCGGTLSCGTCSSNQTCSSNKCGAATNPTKCSETINVDCTSLNPVSGTTELFAEPSVLSNSICLSNANCPVLLNASNNNVFLSGNNSVNGTLIVEGGNVTLAGGLNVTNLLIVSSGCLNVQMNAQINASGAAEFVGQSPNCTSYFNGTLIVNTTSPPSLQFNGNNYSIFFNFSGPLVFNGATVNSTSNSSAGSAATASQITINNSNFFLASNISTVFNSSYPILFTGNSIPPNMNFIPCVYSPDLTSSSTCIPLYLYGTLTTRGGAAQSIGSLSVNGVFDSNNNSLINTWPAGLTHEYDSVITKGFLNVSIYIPTTTFNTIPYVGIQFSSSPTFDCSAGCVQYYIPVINQ
jgi:phage baseplate assembly protein gpV